jgi:hypothetical protein
VETLHEEVESVLHKLEGAVAELDKRKAWRNILATTRRGPWILGGAALLVVSLLLRRKGEEVKRKSASPGRAIVAGGIGLVAMLAKRWARRLWAGRA